MEVARFLARSVLVLVLAPPVELLLRLASLLDLFEAVVTVILGAGRAVRWPALEAAAATTPVVASGALTLPDFAGLSLRAGARGLAGGLAHLHPGEVVGLPLRDVFDALAVVRSGLHFPGEHGHFGLALGLLGFLGRGILVGLRGEGGGEVATVGAVFFAHGSFLFGGA